MFFIIFLALMAVIFGFMGIANIITTVIEIEKLRKDIK